ncbi:MAG TPA: ATP-dependent RNA helicase HrpA, partial [Gammaproteobacteria bacterium]|nr:ATP-dependent RNA helicase HrpA [Gammaproteobacteria bacterium]
MKQKLQQQLAACTIRDRTRLKVQLDTIDWTDKKAVKRLQQSIGRAQKYRSKRAAGIPAVDLNGGLPIHACISEIEAALSENQIIIVCGDTGSGKTTQLPGLCLAMGRGVDGVIGHTQPRRIAARTVATRIREELNVRNKAVAYKVRHTDTTAPETCIKVMTDGILLAELQSDRRLLQYDTLIIDEAHERSLNIDFLLGYIRQLLPARPELKVIITSATIDVDRFSKHFHAAPVVEVSGRTYPVEVRYRPPNNDEAEDNPEDRALLGAVDELNREGRGDILIFLEGEREIHETARLLGKQNYRDTDILPLYSRLSSARQSAIFRPHKRRHIVLATNVAETSLTIPGIHYVIDRGYARISRYSRRSKVQRLPTEKISRASAEQRKGRCGRVAEGICIRLYSEDDFLARPEFTDPEIQRTNLASVILQMKSLGLGEITSFPFIDKPDRRYVNDGIRLLNELSALGGEDELTPVGKKLARLPVDPRLGRIILAAEKRACLPEILIIVSVLSIQDPRERPLESQEKADTAHAQFNDEHSDFVWFLNLWEFYHKHKRGMSRNRLRKLCKQHFLSPVRMREWEDIHKQLVSMVKELGMTPSAGSADYNNLHCALVTGFPGQIACRTGRHEYTGARDLRLYIFPGSSQSGRQPKWIVAAELVETSRLFARTVARIDPRWLVKIVPHLVQYEHYGPYWEADSGQVLCYEKVTMYGLTLSANRKVNYGRIKNVDARRIFINEALVKDGPDYNIDFLSHNRSVIAEVHQLEARARRRDLLDEAALLGFYDNAIPAHVHNIPLLRKWLNKNPAVEQSLLLERDSVMSRPEEAESLEQYPDTLMINDHRLPIEYHFEPGHDNDGIVVNVPLHLLNQLNFSGLDQLVPGMFREKIIAMLKSLPREYRRKLVPVPDTADECVRTLENSSGSLATNLSDYLFRSRGLEIPPEKFNSESLPSHLNIKLQITDKQGNIVDEGRDLDRIKRKHADSARQEFSQTYTGGFDRDGLTDWDFDEIPETISIEAGGKQVRVYP